jgi:hypothetical protein
MDHNRQSDLHRTIAPLRRKIDGAAEGGGAGERESERAGEQEPQKRGDEEALFFSRSPAPPLALSLSRSLALPLALSLCLAGCSRTVTEAEKSAAVDEFFARARSCWPPDGSDGEDAGNPKLAIESVVSDRNATSVRLVAYAPDEAVDFYLPIYRLSAGRWSINEKGRVYLLDEQCREFRLSESKPSSRSSSIFWGGGRIPEGGRIRLKPGQAFVTTLAFPPLPDRTRVGALVYDGRVLPFALD